MDDGWGYPHRLETSNGYLRVLSCVREAGSSRAWCRGSMEFGSTRTICERLWRAGPHFPCPCVGIKCSRNSKLSDAGDRSKVLEYNPQYDTEPVQSAQDEFSDMHCDRMSRTWNTNVNVSSSFRHQLDVHCPSANFV